MVNDTLADEQPYLVKMVETFHYNPAYGDDRLCECGHPYYRHFDSYEDMATVGCKYCRCWKFHPATAEGATP